MELVADRVGIVDGGVTRYEGSVETLAGRVRLMRVPVDHPRAPELPEGVRLISDRVFRGERRLVFEAAGPEAFAALDARVAGALERLPLEEIFIEMVRAR